MDEFRPASPAPRRFARRARPKLVLGGLAAAASVSLSGCGGTPDFQDAQFTSVAECTSAGFPDAVCQSSYNAAFLEHQRSAPQFGSRQDCEKEWGGQHCERLANAGYGNGSSLSSIFVPALAGFVVSQALQRRYYDTGEIDIDYYGGYGGSYRGSPIYRSRGGSTVTVDRSSGSTVTKPVNVNTASVARSGFGGMSMSRSSGSSWGG